ncbi:DUF2625 domain-containing protein [Dickeya zeae]|uniref:DUF2625 domain-containing protein n=1 Tax=Dickeya zeae TaxID=204042 RepID=UPI000C99D5A7|nr:DUF2625 domain-containing protein [Dickeya zeae]AUQ24840.1 hypothetical protein C1O30_07020 [Dickeya zeae]UJR57937.1 DUF2625 domain-containing protein [Dickeya zeae]
MRELTELIDQQRSGWLIVEQWLTDAANNYKVLPCNPTLAKSELHQLQVTTSSPLGAVLFETGGIIVDSGWLRILGSGHSMLPRTLASWTRSVTTDRTFQAFLIADDVSGGFFALNGGEFGKDHGTVYYFAPDTLEWESLDTNYSGFLHWTLNGDLDLFYRSVRWTGWREETSSMNCDAVYSFYPFLWTEPQLSIAQRSRTTVPVDEHWSFCQNLQQNI